MKVIVCALFYFIFFTRSLAGGDREKIIINVKNGQIIYNSKKPESVDQSLEKLKESNPENEKGESGYPDGSLIIERNGIFFRVRNIPQQWLRRIA